MKETYLEGKEMVGKGVTKYKSGSSIGVTKKLSDSVTQEPESFPSPLSSHDQEAKCILKSKSPYHWPPFYLNIEINSLKQNCVLFLILCPN